jgi:hypothetical protein
VSAGLVGRVYRGSLEKMRGAVVVAARVCPCNQCQYTRSRGAGTRWAVAVELDGWPDDLYHAREESFVQRA